MNQNDYFGFWFYAGFLLNTVFLSSSSFFFFLFVAQEEISDGANWEREQSVLDLLKGTDGHLYKGRFRQVRLLSVEMFQSSIWFSLCDLKSYRKKNITLQTRTRLNARVCTPHVRIS